MSVITTSSHLVFACYSKACAPPPAGSGGSKPGGSTRTARFDKRIRSRNPAVKAAAERVLADSIYSGSTKIYHGSSASIPDGGTINPSDSPGAGAAGMDRAAFATRNLLTGQVFAGRSFGNSKTHIYEVAPIKKDLKFLPAEDLGVHVASPSGFRVVRRLDPSEHPRSRPRNELGTKKARQARDKQALLAQTRRRGSPPRRDSGDPKFDSNLKSIGDRLRAKRDANESPEMKAAIDRLAKVISE